MTDNRYDQDVDDLEGMTTDDRKATMRVLANEILPEAAKRHLAVLRDPKVAGQTLNRAIELAFKYGFADQAATRTKELHEMTADELAEAIALLERTAAGRAKLIEHKPAPSVFD
jgi:hypothetical protein